MVRGRPNGLGAPPLGVLALCWGLALATPPASGAQGGGVPDPVAPPGTLQAPAVEGAPRTRISLALLAGTTQFDAGLADYQWDTTPRPAWGFRALIGRGGVAAGARVWRARSSQSIGDLGPAPEVRATSWEVVGEGRLAGLWGADLLATAGAGRLRLAYHPDRVTVQLPGPVSPVVVDLEPVGAWIGGGGFALRRAVAPDWALGLGVETRVFTIDTAHRAGDAIVYARESFGDWSARFELAWLRGPR